MKNKKRTVGWFGMIIIINIIICYLNFNETDHTDHGENAKDTEPWKTEDHSVESAPFDESEDSSTESDKADVDLRERLIEEGYLVKNYWTTMEEEYWELPYADMEAFRFIKDLYAEIEYGGDLTSGDAIFYDEYIEIFKKLMYNRVPFIDRETRQEIFLKDFDGLKYDKEMNYYVYAYTYHFVDIDGDGRPELGIRNTLWHNEEYIFKYIPEDETFILWYTMRNGYYEITGPKKIQWLGNGGQHLAFYQLNEGGEMECYTFFTNGNHTSEEGPYLVMLPIYADRELETAVPEEIKRQGIYIIADKQWYFRVTKEQYDELTAPYMEANRRTEESIKQVSFTYEELFGD